MLLHESEYRCGEYFRFGEFGSEHFILQKNFDDVEGEWTEPAFRHCGVLLYAAGTDRAREIVGVMISVARLLTTKEV